jgi:hypothetical protein
VSPDATLARERRILRTPAEGHTLRAIAEAVERGLTTVYRVVTRDDGRSEDGDEEDVVDPVAEDEEFIVWTRLPPEERSALSGVYARRSRLRRRTRWRGGVYVTADCGVRASPVLFSGETRRASVLSSRAAGCLRSCRGSLEFGDCVA